MIAEGLFERFPVDEVYGMHNTPLSQLGRARIRKGPMMAGRRSSTLPSGAGAACRAAPPLTRCAGDRRRSGGQLQTPSRAMSIR